MGPLAVQRTDNTLKATGGLQKEVKTVLELSAIQDDPLLCR
jgi:hypothetical protein